MMVRVTLDEWQGKKMLQTNYQDWLWKHRFAVKRHADYNIAFEGRDEFIGRVLYKEEDSFISYLIIHQEEIYTEAQRLDRFISKMSSKGGLHIIVGGRGSGKTYLAFYTAWKLHARGKRIWYLGPPVELPDFIEESTISFDKVPEGVIVIMDEASVQFFSRKAGTQKQDEVIRQLPLVRQTNKTYIVITQNLMLQDVNFLRQVSSITFTKYPVLQEETERARKPLKLMHDLELFLPNRVGQALYYDDEEFLFIHVPMRSWWKEEYSVPYRRFRSEAEKLRFIIRLSEELDAGDISIQLSLRSAWMDPMDVEKMLMITKGYDTSYLLSLGDNKLTKLVRMGYDDTPINSLVNDRFLNIKGDFKLSPIQEERIRIDMEKMKLRDPDAWLFSNRNMNMLFLEDLRNRLLVNDQNIILSIYGDTGTGKSLSSISIGMVIATLTGTEFSSLNHIWFHPEEVLQNLRNCKRYNTMILDEQTQNYGSGSGRIEGELRNVEETIRKEQINLIFNSPTLRGHIHHYILKTAGYDSKHKMFKLLVYSQDAKSLIGYITVAVPPQADIDEYGRKKDSYTSSVKNREALTNKDEIAKAITSYQPWLKASNVTERVAAVGRYFRENGLGQPTMSEQHEISGLAKLLLQD